MRNGHEMRLGKLLEGIRVLDFTRLLAGAGGSTILANLGAEVIRVEWSEYPALDFLRLFPPFADGVEGINRSGFFANINTDKLSVTLNMNHQRGRDICKRLIAISDVLAENFSPGVMEQWGLDYAGVRSIKEDIVYVSAPGFGHRGPYKDFRTFGPTAQAFSGLTFMSGLPDRPPAGWGYSYADHTAAYYVAASILLGTHFRNRTGRGQFIEVPQALLSSTLTGSALLDFTVNGRPSRRPGNPPGNHAGYPCVAPHNTYRCAGDDRWVVISVYSDIQWESLVRIIGDSRLCDGERFGGMPSRVANQDLLDQIIQEWTIERDAFNIMENLQQGGVPCGVVQTAQDKVERDSQLGQCEFYIRLDHPEMGHRLYEGLPLRISDSPVRASKSAPCIGEHNQYVYGELLGLSAEEIDELQAEHVIGDQISLKTQHQQVLNLRQKIEHGGTMMSKGVNEEALSDIVVLEMADQKGEWCGKLFADMGAEVIKIEETGGSSTRRIGPFLDDMPHADRSLHFLHNNTNKKSVTLNIHDRDGQRLLKRLVKLSDVIIETTTPGFLSEKGLDYDELCQINHGLIMTSITPFGQSGPYRFYASSDIVQLALGGIMAMNGYDDIPGTPPIAPIGGHSWQIASHWAFIGTLAALVARDKTGSGNHVDVSVHEAVSTCTELAFPIYAYTGEIVKRQTGRHAMTTTTPPTQFRTVDGCYMNTAMIGIDTKKWLEIVEWLDSYGHAEDLTDNKYLTPEVLQDEWPHVLEVVGRFVGKHKREELFQAAQERGLVWGPVNSPEELVDDPHMKDVGFFVEVDHEELGKTFLYPGAPYSFSETPWQLHKRAPLTGEQNEEIYCERLGISRRDLSILAEKGVI